jgi:hypothetical protein
MSHIVKVGADKLPTILGGGILGVAGIGLGFGIIGIPLTVAMEGVSALVGMAVASRFA